MLYDSVNGLSRYSHTIETPLTSTTHYNNKTIAEDNFNQGVKNYPVPKFAPMKL